LFLIIFCEIVLVYQLVKYVLFVIYVSTCIHVIFSFIYITMKQRIIQKLITFYLNYMIITLLFYFFFLNLRNLNRILIYFLSFCTLLFNINLRYYLIKRPFKTYFFITYSKCINRFLLKLFLNLFQYYVFNILFQIHRFIINFITYLFTRFFNLIINFIYLYLNWFLIINLNFNNILFWLINFNWIFFKLLFLLFL